MFPDVPRPYTLFVDGTNVEPNDENVRLPLVVSVPRTVRLLLTTLVPVRLYALNVATLTEPVTFIDDEFTAPVTFIAAALTNVEFAEKFVVVNDVALIVFDV